MKFLWLWFPVFLIMAFIFCASSVPGEDIPPLLPYQDIVFHFAVYGCLAYFLARALKNTYLTYTLKKVILLSVLFSVFYGVSDELHQLFVINRSASVFDVCIDGIGSFFGSTMYR
jgi:VanZ family protein